MPNAFLSITDHRIAARCHGGIGVLMCADQLRAMAFAQLNHRENWRGIGACLLAQAAKLYHMRFRKSVSQL